jgi:hypothetical protein
LTPSSSRVATRHVIRLAARDACRTTFCTRTASVNLTERVLVAVAEGALVPDDGSPVRTAGLLNLPRKLAELAKAVKQFPNLWEKIKDFIGVESLADIPARVKELAKEGYAALKKLLAKAFDVWPLKLYTLPENKLFSVNKMLEKLMAKYPQFGEWLEASVKPRVDQFDKWLKEHLPTVSKVLMVAIYIWIWLNVVEFEWDLKGILEAATGQLSLSSLLASLPGSAIGAMMNGLGLGTFTLLPAATAVRLLLLMSKRYLTWTGSGFDVAWDKLSADIGLDPDVNLDGALTV